jgi:hypothetical protein
MFLLLDSTRVERQRDHGSKKLIEQTREEAVMRVGPCRAGVVNASRTSQLEGEDYGARKNHRTYRKVRITTL